MTTLLLPSGIRTLSTQESHWLTRDKPDLPATPRNCVVCGGTGRFRWWANEGHTATDDYVCDCDSMWIIGRYFAFAGLGLSYQKLRWEDTTWVDPHALNVVLSYLERAPGMIANGRGLILSGGLGCGKTLLLTLMLKALLADGFSGSFVDFSQLISRMMGSWDSEDGKKWFAIRAISPAILIIDDVGRELQRTEFVDGKYTKVTRMGAHALELVVRERIANDRPVMITTNLNLRQMNELYGDNLISLLQEKCEFVEVPGSDRRREISERTDAEINAGIKRPLVIG